MARIIIYVVFIGVLALGIGSGFNDSIYAGNNNSMAQDTYFCANEDPCVGLRIDPAPLYFGNNNAMAQDVYSCDPCVSLRIDPAPLHFMEGVVI